MTARGIRNNNPGNIRWGDNWQGLVVPDQRTDPDFCQFVDAPHGIRAIAVILSSYKGTGIDTIRAAINRWAPPSENDTDAYVNAVASGAGVDADACVDLTSFAVCNGVVRSIIQHENGAQPYTDDTINQGLSLAGITP